MSVLILMYHGVEPTKGPLFVTPALFAAHLDAIVAARLPVLTMGEVGDRLEGGRLPPRAVALTFDDGFQSVISEAAPLLIERGLRATVFCVAGRLGGTNNWPTARSDAPSVRLAPAADLSRLANAGFEIGAHGMEHAPLDTEDPDEIRREIRDAHLVLGDAVGVRIGSFAYPYGALPTRAADMEVRQVYSTACTTRIGRVDTAANPYALPRVDAHYLRSLRLFRAVVEGRADTYLILRRFAAGARRRIRPDYSRHARSG